MLQENICSYYKFGFCKLQDECEKIHNAQECKNKVCSSDKCSKRHPKPCSSWEKFGKCRLGENCAYKHEKIEKKCYYWMKFGQCKKKNNCDFKHEEKDRKKNIEMHVSQSKKKANNPIQFHQDRDVVLNDFMQMVSEMNDKFSKILSGTNRNHERYPKKLG